jgi:hypothetical protein
MRALAMLAAVCLAGCSGRGPVTDEVSPAREADLPPLAAEPRDGGGYGAPAVSFEPAADRGLTWVSVTVPRVAGAPPLGGELTYTAEPFTLAITPDGEMIQESDLGRTGLALDLDGDGAIDGAHRVRCEAGDLVIGEARARPLMTGGEDGVFYTYRDGGAPRLARFGPRGVTAVLYSPCDQDPVVVGLWPAGAPATLSAVTGPAVQVLFVEEVAGPGEPPAITIEEMTMGGAPVAAAIHVSHVYEPLLSAEPAWAVATWFLVTLPPDAGAHELRFAARAGPGPARKSLIAASINARAPGHDRVRTHAVAVPVPAR